MNQEERRELKAKLKSLKPQSKGMTKKERGEAFDSMVNKQVNSLIRDILNHFTKI